MVYVIWLLSFLAFGLVCYWVLEVYGDTVEEIQQRQVDAGDASLAEIAVYLPPGVLLVIRLMNAGMFFMIGSAVFVPEVGVIFAILGFLLPTLYLKRLQAQRLKQIETQLIEALELLGNSLKSGMTLQQGMELVVQEFPPPLSVEFNTVISENRLGVDFNDALQNMADRLGSVIVHILATGVAVTKKCGGDMTEIFGNIATTIREQAQIEGKLDAVTAQGRFQGMILSVLPFALVVILWFIDRAHVQTLFGYKVGIMAFGLVIVMVIMAQAWINKLLKLDV